GSAGLWWPARRPGTDVIVSLTPAEAGCAIVKTSTGAMTARPSNRTTSDCSGADFDAAADNQVAALMKAIVRHRYGSPDVLRYEDVDMPAIEDDQVLIKVRAASVNPLDWHFLTGTPY